MPRGGFRVRGSAPLDALKAGWFRFRGYSLTAATAAYYAAVLGGLYLEVGSKLMLILFGVIVTTFVIGILARLMNGCKLIAIAGVHAVAVALIVRVLEHFGVESISEVTLLQITLPFGMATAWILDDRRRTKERTRTVTITQ